MLPLPFLEVYHDLTKRSAAMNMALDEILWHTATLPRLRFYGWDHPAASFGYFGRYSDVVQFESDHDLVRRCTGGGIVFHGDDLTYALTIPAAAHLRSSAPTAVYAGVHTAIARALQELGTAAKLVPSQRPNWPRPAAAPAKPDPIGRCFANPVPYDVVVHDQKIAGAAQRRSRRALLQQGSIQNLNLPADFPHRFSSHLAQRVASCEITSDVIERASALARSKYATDVWLRRR